MIKTYENKKHINFALLKNKLLRKYKNDKKSIIVTISVLYFLALICILLLLKPNPEKSINSFFNAWKDHDSKEISNYIYPSLVKELEKSSGMDIQELLDVFFEDEKDDNFKLVDFKVDSDYKEYNENETEEIAVKYNIIKKDIKEVKEYAVMLKISDDGERERIKTNIIVLKIESKWYVIFDELFSELKYY